MPSRSASTSAPPRKYGGKCNLRFDDTNPAKEDVEYVDSIMDDVRWLGFQWDAAVLRLRLFRATLRLGRAAHQEGQGLRLRSQRRRDREHRGTLTKPGKDSPYRNRAVEENLDLFARMKAGEFPDGARTLRAKIDMASPNFNMRDPVMYRILHPPTTAPAISGASIRCTTGPMASAIPSSASRIRSARWNSRTIGRSTTGTSSELGIYAPQQIEFARLNLSYTIMSKRKLLELVQEKYVSGWDDPRMPTISGIRRRGYTPEAIRDFCERSAWPHGQRHRNGLARGSLATTSTSGPPRSWPC